ncbi:MAG: hypothetical protein ACE5HM_08720 [Acidiferrobacterales bacterium]
MNTQLVFARTDKGASELGSRKYHLPPRLRIVLILVDGKSNVAQLRGKAQSLAEFESLLEDLAIQGFIQTNSPAWDRRVGAGTQREYNGTDRRRRSADSRFTPIKARLINVAILTFGANAENVVKKFQDAPGSWQGLEAAITDCAKLVGLVFGTKRAEEFESKCWQILSKALHTTLQEA